MDKSIAKKISFFVLFFFLSLLICDSYPMPQSTRTETECLALIEKGEVEYSEGFYQEALDSFSKALGMVQEKEYRERLLLGISLVYYALGDNERCLETLRTLLETNPEKQISQADFPKGFFIFYNQTKLQVQERILEIKKSEERKHPDEFKKSEDALQLETAKNSKERPLRVIEQIKKEKESVRNKKNKFPLLLIVLGVGVIAALILILSKKKKSSNNPDQYGRLQINSIPVNAKIYLDGADTGKMTNSLLEGITIGSHSIRLVLQNHSDFTATVNIKENQTETVNAEMVFDFNKIEWLQIPAGNFRMGDNFGDGYGSERPVHTVYLDAYYISKYEVTFDLYDRFCTETNRTKPDDSGWGRGTRPVINVSWDDAQAFCNWLSGKIGKKTHLPTEAQWEKAARGTDQRKYPWGNSTPSCSLCNYNRCAGDKTQPVGTYLTGVSAFLAFDMAGNVHEWCQDLYDRNYYQHCNTQGTVRNPQGPSVGSGRIFRGGSWDTDAKGVRSCHRDYAVSATLSYDLGFRLAKEN